MIKAEVVLTKLFRPVLVFVCIDHSNNVGMVPDPFIYHVFIRTALTERQDKYPG